MKTWKWSAPPAIFGLAALALTIGCGSDGGDPQQQNKPVIGTPYQSECLDGQDADDDTVEILVSGNTATVVDRHAEFNCCLSVWMEVEIAGREINVVEEEDPDDSTACDCICPYELSIQISNLAEGSYTVRVYRLAAEPAALIHQETITIGASAPAAHLSSFQAWCGKCGEEECYQPGAPLGQSTFGFELEPDPDQEGLWRIRASHTVQCIDVHINGAEFFVDGTEMTLVEQFDYANPFDCYCTQQAAFIIAAVAPGTYDLRIYDNDRTRLLVEESLIVSP